MASRTLAKRRDGKEKRVRAAPARPAVPPPETIPERRVRAPARLYTTKNDLPETTRLEVIGLLNQRLAEAIDLQTQCKQAHWNVKGPSFIGLHKLFDDVNEDVEEYEDQIAERIDRKSTRLNSSHSQISYAVFCLKKK